VNNVEKAAAPERFVVIERPQKTVYQEEGACPALDCAP
jgi:hypothetical protein